MHVMINSLDQIVEHLNQHRELPTLKYVALNVYIGSGSASSLNRFVWFSLRLDFVASMKHRIILSTIFALKDVKLICLPMYNLKTTDTSTLHGRTVLY